MTDRGLTLDQVREKYERMEPGYVVGIKQAADKGKSAVGVAIVFDLVNYHGYQAESVYSDLTLDLPGSHFVEPEEIRQLLRDMARKPLRHVIVLIDEINSVFPSRFFKNQQQTEDLLGLWQATKLGNWVIYTHHLGTSIDKIIRDSTQIELIPEYNKEKDTIYIDEINCVDCVTEGWEISNASELFKKYWRWQPVAVTLMGGKK